MTNQRAQFADQWRRWAVTALVIATLAAALSAPVRGGAAPKAPPVTLNTEIQHWGFYPSFSPDGKTIACIAALHQVNLWDSRTGALRLILAPTKPRTVIQSLTWSPDGKWLAGGDWDAKIHVWDARTGAVTRVLPESGGMIFSLKFSPDGKLLAAGCVDGHVRLWDALTGELRQTLRDPVGEGRAIQTGMVSSVDFSADGALLASGGADDLVCLWEVSTGKLLKRLGKPKTPNLQQIALAFAPAGRTLAVATPASGLRLWNTTTEKFRQLIDNSDETLCSVSFSQDGAQLVVGWFDGQTALFDAATGEIRQKFVGLGSHGSLSPDGRRLAMSRFHDATVVHVRSGRLAASFTIPVSHEEGRVTREWIAYTPEGYYTGRFGEELTPTVYWKAGEQVFWPDERTQYDQPERVAASLQGSVGER